MKKVVKRRLIDALVDAWNSSNIKELYLALGIAKKKKNKMNHVHRVR